MTAGSRLGVLGGTLDPIHTGHLETALAARRALALDGVVIIPSGMPPHRGEHPHASPFHRFAMAALAVDGCDGLTVSDLEMCASGPSFTADTLTRLAMRMALKPSQIFFITGADAFAEIATWSRYPAVLDLAQFAVISRPGTPATSMRARLPELAARMRDAAEAQDDAAETSIFLVDAATPDVSSTDVRRRCRAGESLAGLVPPPVERHIRHHGLYRTA